MDDIDAANFGLLVLRSWVGIVMLAHGIRHIFGGGKIKGTAGWFESLGMKPGIVHAWIASLTEVGVGAGLIAGLFTPLCAAGVIGTMFVAFVTNHFKNGFFIFYKGEGYEYVTTLIMAGVAMSALGAGEWSLDNALDLTWVSGDSGVVIGGLGGFGGALLLLAGFWRPPPREPAA
jgi:putative oxidoreductase